MFSKAVWVVALVLLALPAAAQSTTSLPQGPHVVVVPIDGMIDEGISVLVKRVVRESQDAQAIIFVIDTFGGRVDSAVDIATSIMDAPCPTVAYIVGRGAISAGALISFACDHIIMKPGTNIGAAQPVLAGPEGMQPTGEKEVSFVREKMRSLAEENGHNPDIAEAMVDERVVLQARVVDGKLLVEKVRGAATQASSPNVEEAAERLIESLGADVPEPLREFLKTVGENRPATPQPAPAADPAPAASPTPGVEIIDGSDQLLTLTSKAALLYGVIPVTARNVTEVAEHFGYGEAPRYEAALTWGEKAFRFITNPLVASLLLALGLGGIYLEIKTPGFGLPGVLGIACLALFFGAHYVIGLVDWIDIVLVVAGIGLLLAEIFVIPGFGIAGISGIACILLGLYLSLTRVIIPEFSWQYDQMRTAALTLLGAFTALAVFIALLIRILPQTPIYRRIVLDSSQVATLGYTVQSDKDRLDAIGLTGTASTVLRPAGRGRFSGKTLQVVSRAEYIDEGTPIVIVEVEGNRYVVEPVDSVRAS